MKKQVKGLALLLIVVIILSACSTPPVQESIPGLALTLAVRTMVATQRVSYFATTTPTALPTVFAEPAIFYSEFTPTPLSTPVPSLTPFNYTSSEYLAPGKCKNRAEFVKDITISDESRIKSGQRFTKVWLLRNNGTCIWTPDYALVFTEGDQMGGASPKPIGAEVKPGETIEMSIDLIAPKNSNYYQGNWMLQDEDGNIFGAGNGKMNYFWVSIIVGSGGNKLGGVFGRICGGGG